MRIPTRFYKDEFSQELYTFEKSFLYGMCDPNNLDFVFYTYFEGNVMFINGVVGVYVGVI